MNIRFPKWATSLIVLLLVVISAEVLAEKAAGG